MNKPICRTETDSQTLRAILQLPRGTGGGGGRDGLGVWDWHMYTEVPRMIDQQGTSYSTENSTQYFVIIYVGKESERK